MISRIAPASSRAATRAGALAVAVGLVDGDHVGQLEDAALDALQLVAGAREREQQERVDHLGDGDLGLPDADGLDDHDVVAGGLEHEHRLARGAGHAAERRPEGQGRMKAARWRRARPSGSGRRGSSRRCGARSGRRRARRPGGRVDQPASQRVDERRLAGTGHAGDADAHGATGGAAMRVSSSAAGSRWSARVDSTSVIARATCWRAPARTPAARSATSTGRHPSRSRSSSSRSTAARR